MADYDESIDVDVDSNDVHSSDGRTSDDEDSKYSISSGSDDGFDTGESDDDAGSHDESDDDVGSHDECDDDAAESDRSVRINSMNSDEISALEFGSVDEAYDFYCEYGRCKGFSIRKSSDKKKGPEGRIVSKLFVCSNQGVRDKKYISKLDRKRDHRRMTRTNCTTRLRVTYKPKKDRFVVSVFEETHNHELTPLKYVHLHPVFRKISEADRAQIDGMQSRGIRTCHIMGYMVAQKGGYGSVGFTRKDLYNYFDKKMREVTKDGDVVASLNYLNARATTDPMMYAKCATDGKDGRLKSLFWADGNNRSDYFCFGDVLAFDTTYKKNKYNYPLVIFSGCNHHSQTTIFGAAIVSNETTETYIWVLNCFLDCMEKKHPRAVVTDGDGAMREAIKEVFPDASHRLCSWHLNKNANDNIKKSGFSLGFKKAMYSNFTEDEFEDYWSELVKEFDLEGNLWVMKTYANKSLWATAYLRDRFFGRIRTTSQCEAINAIIKTYVRNRSTIFEFIHNYEEAVRNYRNSEMVADFKSKFSEPVLTTQLPLIESQAAKIYTAEIFVEVRGEIMKAGQLIVRLKKEIGNTKLYTLTKYCNDEYERKVVYDGHSFQCSCKLFDHRGLPCSHIFHVMKEEHVDHIPSSLVLARWTKDAKIDYLNMLDVNGSVESSMMEVARFGAYCSVLTTFCKEVSKKEGVYADVMDDLMKLRRKYLNVADRDETVGTQKSAVGDPIPVKGKGPQKKKKNEPKAIRSCTKCNSTTHNARTCSKKRKRSWNGESSVQSKGSEQPKGRRSDSNVQKKKKCSELPKDNGANLSMTPHMAVASTSRQFHPMYGLQPMMPMLNPAMQPMHAPYQVYGLNVGAESASGLLQQVLQNAEK